MDFALNNLERLVCYKTQPTNQPTSPYYNFVTSTFKKENLFRELSQY